MEYAELEANNANFVEEYRISYAMEKAGIGPVEVTSMSWVPMDTASSMSDSLPREEDG